MCEYMLGEDDRVKREPVRGNITWYLSFVQPHSKLVAYIKADWYRKKWNHEDEDEADWLLNETREHRKDEYQDIEDENICIWNTLRQSSYIIV